MIYQLWRTGDGEILIVGTNTDTERNWAKQLEKQGCDLAGTMESTLPPDTIRDGIAKKYIDLCKAAARRSVQLSAKIETAQAIVDQILAAVKEGAEQ